jgi:phage/plasmid-associated DNA primase
VVADDAKATVTQVYQSYAAWCQDNGITPLGIRNFNTRLLSAGYEKKKTERGFEWIGLGIPRPTGWIATSARRGWQQRE